MPTTNATPTVTRGEIVALRRSAVLAGNDALVADCDRVLTPFGRRDLDALDRCRGVLALRLASEAGAS
jgi:hypothetical protein